jgi:hypothetical protein
MGEVACGERKRAFLDLYLFPSLTFISLARPAFFSLSQSSALARQGMRSSDVGVETAEGRS